MELIKKEKVIKGWLIYILSIGLFYFLSSCIQFRNASALSQLSFILDKCVLCAEVEVKADWAQPSQEKKVFIKGADKRVYSFLSFKDVRGEHALVWKWYDPSGKIYRSTEKTNIGREGQYFEKYIAWDNILLFEEKESGKWTIAVFVDDIFLSSREFEIQ